MEIIKILIFLFKSIIVFLRRFFWGCNSYIKQQTRISFLACTSSYSTFTLTLTQGGTVQSHPAYCMLVDCMRRSFGFTSGPIQVDYSRMECKDILIQPRLGFIPNFVSYEVSIAGFDGFVFALEERELYDNERSALEFALNYLQVDDALYFDDVEEAKGSYHRPILLIYSIKSKKRIRDQKERFLRKQVEELIEKTKFDKEQFHVIFAYETNFELDQQDKSFVKKQDEEFYSAIEWLFRKCVMK